MTYFWTTLVYIINITTNALISPHHYLSAQRMEQQRQAYTHKRSLETADARGKHSHFHIHSHTRPHLHCPLLTNYIWQYTKSLARHPHLLHHTHLCMARCSTAVLCSLVPTHTTPTHMTSATDYIHSILHAHNDLFRNSPLCSSASWKGAVGTSETTIFPYNTHLRYNNSDTFTSQFTL